MVTWLLGLFYPNMNHPIQLTVLPCIIGITITLFSQATKYEWAALATALWIFELVIAKHKQHTRAMSFQLMIEILMFLYRF